jgi:hypothetical protein
VGQNPLKAGVLKEHPATCKVDSPSHRGTGSKAYDKQAADKHDHGSLNCIVAFLGDANWSRSKVGRILEAANKLLRPTVGQTKNPKGTKPSPVLINLSLAQAS